MAPDRSIWKADRETWILRRPGGLIQRVGKASTNFSLKGFDMITAFYLLTIVGFLFRNLRRVVTNYFHPEYSGHVPCPGSILSICTASVICRNIASFPLTSMVVPKCPGDVHLELLYHPHRGHSGNGPKVVSWWCFERWVFSCVLLSCVVGTSSWFPFVCKCRCVRIDHMHLILYVMPSQPQFPDPS